jgi:hypothetical protein
LALVALLGVGLLAASAVPTPTHAAGYGSWTTGLQFVNAWDSSYDTFNADQGLNPGDSVQFCVAVHWGRNYRIGLYAQDGDSNVVGDETYVHQGCRVYQIPQDGELDVYLDNTDGSATRAVSVRYRYDIVSQDTQTTTTTTTTTPQPIATPTQTPSTTTTTTYTVPTSYYQYSDWSYDYKTVDEGSYWPYQFGSGQGLHPGDQVQVCFNSTGLWNDGLNFYAQNGYGNSVGRLFWNYRNACEWFPIDNSGQLNVYLDNTNGKLSRFVSISYRYYYKTTR